MTTTNLYAPVENKEAISEARLVVKMPVELRDQFKKHCEKHKLDMSLVIRRFIAAEVGKVAE